MILPNLPSKFSSGETLTAAKLNTMIDWMRDIARILPSLQVNTGPGLVYSRSSAGTTVSLAHGYIQASTGGDASTYVHPFKVSVGEDGSVTVAPGTSYTLIARSAGYWQRAGAVLWDETTFPPGSAKSFGGVVVTDPLPDGCISVIDDLSTRHESAIVIAEFIDYGDGQLKVRQYLRSDAYHVRADIEL